MRTLSGLFLMLALLVIPGAAEQLETDFFQVPVPEGWQTSRSATGLWQLKQDMPFELTATFLVNRLKTTPEMYLQGTVELWKTQGATEGNFDGRRLECLITPADGDPLFKIVSWEEDILVVATFMFSVKHTDEALNTAQRLTQDLEIHNPNFEPEALRKAVNSALKRHENTPEELAEAVDIRRQMTSFRQDWEPYFIGPSPPLFEAFSAYLEARYDAAFVVANGKEMGMPESVLQSRLKSIENRRSELLRVLQNNV
jgi:hypothetical protein